VKKTNKVVKLRNYLCELYLVENIVKRFLIEGNGELGLLDKVSIIYGEYHLDDLIDG